MYLFGTLCLLALSPSIGAAEPPQALQQRDPADKPSFWGYDGRDLEDAVSSEDSGKDKDKPSNLTATVTPSLVPVVLPSKDLPSSTSTNSDKDKDKDDKTYPAPSTPSSAPTVLPSKDLPSSTSTNSDKDKDKDNKTYPSSSTLSTAPIVLPSKDLPSSTTIDSDKDKTKDDKTPTTTSTPISSTNHSTSMPDKDKDSSTTPLKDKTSSIEPTKDISSKTDNSTITNLASLTLSLISPATTLPSSTNPKLSSAPLTPPMIMYTVTLKPKKPSSALPSSETKLYATGTSLPSSKISGSFPSQSALTSVFGSTFFPGYSVVPSPSESGTKADKGSLSNLSSATIPVWTQPMLGNAYGGGFVTTPSIFVTRLPFPSGPLGNVPPGYGIPSKSQNSTLSTADSGNQMSAATPVNSRIFSSASTEAVKTTSPPYQNATGVSENVPSASIFISVSSQSKKPKGQGGATSSVRLSLIPFAPKSEATRSILAPAPSSPGSRSAVLYSTSFGVKPESTSLGGYLSPSSVQSDRSIPNSTGIGGKPEASKSTAYDTKSSPKVTSGELPTASPAGPLQSSQFELAGSTRPLVPTTSLKPGSTLPLLSTPSFANSLAQQYPGTFQLSSASPSIVSSLAELAGTTTSPLPTSSSGPSFGNLEGQTIPTPVTPSQGKAIGGSVPLVQTTSLQSSLVGQVGSIAPPPRIPIPTFTPNLDNGTAGMLLPFSPTLSLTSSLGDELSGTTPPLVPTPSLASSLGKELAGTTPPLVLTPSLASNLVNELAGTTLPLVPTPSFAFSSGELGGSSLPLVSTTSLASSLGNEIAGTFLPPVPSPGVSSTLESELAGATPPLLPTTSFPFSSGELGDKTAPIPSTSGSTLAAVEPENPTSVPAVTGKDFASESTSTSALTAVKPEGPMSVPTVTGQEAAAESTSTSALATVKPEGPMSVPTVTGKDSLAESASSSAFAGLKPEGPMSVPTVSGKDSGAESTSLSAFAGLKPEGSTLVPAVTGKDVTAESTAAPTGETGSGSKASASSSSGDKPKQITEGVVSSAPNPATAQQPASTLSDSNLGGGDAKSDTSLPIGGKGATEASSIAPATPSAYTVGGIPGVTPNPAAESTMASSAIGISGSASRITGPLSNASIAFNVTPTAIQYFEGSAAHVSWSFGVALITFLTFLFWL